MCHPELLKRHLLSAANQNWICREDYFLYNPHPSPIWSSKQRAKCLDLLLVEWVSDVVDGEVECVGPKVVRIEVSRRRNALAPFSDKSHCRAGSVVFFFVLFLFLLGSC